MKLPRKFTKCLRIPELTYFVPPLLIWSSLVTCSLITWTDRHIRFRLSLNENIWIFSSIWYYVSTSPLPPSSASRLPRVRRRQCPRQPRRGRWACSWPWTCPGAPPGQSRPWCRSLCPLQTEPTGGQTKRLLKEGWWTAYNACSKDPREVDLFGHVSNH